MRSDETKDKCLERGKLSVYKNLLKKKEASIDSQKDIFSFACFTSFELIIRKEILIFRLINYKFILILESFVFFSEFLGIMFLYTCIIFPLYTIILFHRATLDARKIHGT